MQEKRKHPVKKIDDRQKAGPARLALG